MGTVTPIQPVDSSCQDQRLPLRHHVQYRYLLIAREELPRFDASKTLRESLLPSWLDKAHARVMHKYHRLLDITYLLAVVTRVIAIFGPAPIGRVFAVVSPVLQIPGTLSMMSQFRIAYVRLLLRTFEFWYFLAVNTLWMVAFGLHLQDARVVLLPFMSLEFQNTTVIDTYFRASKPIIIVGLATVCQLVMLIVALTLDLLDQASHVAIVTTSHRELTTREALLYSTTAVLFLTARIVYRRHAAMKTRQREMRDTASTVPVSLYQDIVARAPR